LKGAEGSPDDANDLDLELDFQDHLKVKVFFLNGNPYF